MPKILPPAEHASESTERHSGTSEPVLFASSFVPEQNGCIHSFAFNSETGTLSPLRRTTGIRNPFFMVVSRDRRFLYTIDAETFGGVQEEAVAAFTIAGTDGALRFLNRRSTRGTESCHLDIDRDGKTLVVANYSTGNVASLPLNPDGSIEEAVSVIPHSGSSVHPERQKQPHAHCFVVSPDGRHALAADLGIDRILIYALDTASGKLSPNAAQPFASLAPGSGPRHLTFHPNHRAVYVINELSGSITAFDWSGTDGCLNAKQTIATLPPDFAGTNLTADLKITPDGRHLYGTNRGHDSLAAYRVAENGFLELISIQPSGGGGPQNLLITPDGRWLLVANMPGNKLSVFAIHPETGELTPNTHYTQIARPSCLCWLG